MFTLANISFGRYKINFIDSIYGRLRIQTAIDRITVLCLFINGYC